MSRIIHPARRFAALLRTRRGSVLILVIVILVLLALIGTAMMSTSRIDRVATQQHAQNTQIDLLVESVENMAKASIQKDMYGTDASGAKTFRSGTGYLDYDGFGDTQGSPAAPAGTDEYLCSRHPISSGGTYGWPWISTYLTGTTYESPYIANTGDNPQYRIRQNVPIAAAGAKITYADGTSITYPGFTVGGLTRLAGDADGDGMPDCALFRLPIGNLNGVTYYAGTRILDNNSAINASTALSSSTDSAKSDGTGSLPVYGFFASNVDMVNELTAGDSMTNLNSYRMNSQVIDTATAMPVNDFGTNGATVSDFKYASFGDLLNNQIARRLSNPGRVRVQTGTTDLLSRAQSLPLSESLTMAYRFCIQSPYSSGSVLESATTGIPNSVKYINGVNNIPTKPYVATDVTNWFNNNFNFAGGSMPMRSYLVARNGVQTLATSQNLSLLPAGYQASATTSTAAAANLIPIPSATVPLLSTNPVDKAAAAAFQIPKASVNTAPFNILWRGFWNVMANGGNKIPNESDLSSTGGASGITGVASSGNPHMFTPPIRDPNANWNFTATDEPRCFGTLMLRAAIAANNTINLRNAGRFNSAGNQEYNVISRQVAIYDSANTFLYNAMIYGTQPQPYITEILVDTDQKLGQNPKGYVGIELFNPYPFNISLKNWQIGVVNRPAAPASNPQQLKILPLDGSTTQGLYNAAASAGATVGAGQYLLLENYSAAAPVDASVTTYAKVAPGERGLPTNVFYVPYLHEVLSDPAVATPNGGEMELLRPRRMVLTGSVYGGTLQNDSLTSSAATGNTFNENTPTGVVGTSPILGTASPVGLQDFIPADQFDFTGQTLAAAGATAFTAMHYVRPSSPTADSASAWKFVYPGFYDPKATTARQEGTQVTNWDTTAAPPGNANSWDPASGASYVAPMPPIALSAEDGQATYNDSVPPIQLANLDMPGFLPQTNLPGGAPANAFPYGGFGRNGDILDVPYIASYRLTDNAANILELNAVTTDASFAHSGSAAPTLTPTTGASRVDHTNDAYENIGRFCPMADSAPAFTVTQPALPAPPIPQPPDSYAWAGSLFKYFDVWAPGDDYFPNVDPATIDATTPAQTPGYFYPPGNGGKLNPTPGVAPIPYPVSNAGSSTPGDSRDIATMGSEDTLPVEGRININTASAQVLQSLPFSATAGTNKTIAQLIVDYRDGTGNGWTPATAHGPFTSIMDLNKVVTSGGANGFQNLNGALPADPGQTDGDTSPILAGKSDGVANDFERNFLVLNRISNLITTRSDTFTVYVLVQGWQNVGTATPTLVVQRRAAIIVDRTAMSPTNGSVTTTNIPAD